MHNWNNKKKNPISLTNFIKAKKIEQRKINITKFKKDLENIKSIKQNIAYLKEQLKEKDTRERLNSEESSTISKQLAKAPYKDGKEMENKKKKNKNLSTKPISAKIKNDKGYSKSNYSKYYQNHEVKNNKFIESNIKEFSPNKTLMTNTLINSVDSEIENNKNKKSSVLKEIYFDKEKVSQAKDGIKKKNVYKNKYNTINTENITRLEDNNKNIPKKNNYILKKPNEVSNQYNLLKKKKENAKKITNVNNISNVESSNIINSINSQNNNVNNSLVTQKPYSNNIRLTTSSTNNTKNNKKIKNKVDSNFDNHIKKKKEIIKGKIRITKEKGIYINEIDNNKYNNKGIKKKNSYNPPPNKSLESEGLSDNDLGHNKHNINASMENISSAKIKEYLDKCEEEKEKGKEKKIEKERELQKTKVLDKIGIVCKAGEAVFGEPKINQDNFFFYVLADNLRFSVVCDGHGAHGHHVSEYLRNNLPIELEKELKKLFIEEEPKNIGKEEIYNSIEKIRKVFESSFKSTDINLEKYSLNNQFTVEYSGSTCVSILMPEKDMKKIYIGNVGDSRAIVVKEYKQEQKWVYKQLSRDHKPTEPDEYDRIIAADGEVEKIEDDDGNWTGPLRVWVKGSDGPGLAMTRSLGDKVGESVGVVCTPEVTEYKIEDEDRALIIASDGIWEYMSNEEVTDIVGRLFETGDADTISTKLFDDSLEKWHINDQGIDDITIIVVLLKSEFI